MSEISTEINNEIRCLQLAITPADELVKEIGGLIEDEQLPESYLHQLSAAILRHDNDIYDMSEGEGSMEGDIPAILQRKLSFLLFAMRVIDYEVFSMLRRFGQPKMASTIHKHIRQLEEISQMLDNKYRQDFGVVLGPALSARFWDGRPAHPVESAKRLITDGYV